MSFDRTAVHSTRVFAGEELSSGDNSEIIRAFKSFILEFRLDSQFIYREQLRENVLVGRYVLDVNTEHLIGYSEDLYKRVHEDPIEVIPLFEVAITQTAKRIVLLSKDSSQHSQEQQQALDHVDTSNFPLCQLVLNSGAMQIPFRQLDADHVSKIVRITGIIISASILTSRATHLSLMCRTCKHMTTMRLNNFQNLNNNNVQLPRECLADHTNDTEDSAAACGPDPYLIVHESSSFIDQQFLKLQELPESVPIGELPRNLLMTCDRYLTNQVVPGTRVTIIGIYSIYQSKNGNINSSGNKAVAIRNPYVKVLGINHLSNNPLNNSLAMFSEQEEQKFLELSQRPDLYELFASSIAPSIYGNKDIKKAIVCLLMGGSKKLLPDGMRLRGDVNVLLLGDPGTAKSQLLKFVEKVAPISIYTSGKGSSAAGLTASVQRDPTTREFYLEGGAMVLADGGVVCIDEFDKMRDEDRVAIHEAMEQQTISIAKAGITTVLNSRTSVLAAANPVYGRYDDLKSPGENIDFQTTILSRFDMIFIVKDDHNEDRDISIANHVMNIHTGRTNQLDGSNSSDPNSEIPIELMKKYISYCRLKCAPRLSPEAATKLSSHFITIRKQLQESERNSNERSSIPITVRQLEAIIRITESLAKLELNPIATEKHVEEAIRLFQASTMDAASQDPINSNDHDSNTLAQIRRIESELKRRLPIGWSTSYQTLQREFVTNKKLSQYALDKALYLLERHETIQLRHQGQNIYRSGV